MRSAESFAGGAYTESRGGVPELKNHIPTLDGWRAIAILLVLTHHLGTGFFDQGSYWSSSPTRFGVIGVPIFFGLSGFLITALLLQECSIRQHISLRKFYIRRAFRILPPLLVFLLVISGAGLVGTPLEMLSSLLFFRNYVPSTLAGLYTLHLWSLSVEEQFYLLWPLSLCFLLHSRELLRNSRKKVVVSSAPPELLASSLAVRRRAAAPVVLLGNTAMIALSFGVWRSLDFHFHFLHRVAPFLDTSMRTDLRFDSLMWGCCAGILFQTAKLRQASIQWLQPLVFAGALVLLIYCQTMRIPFAQMWEAAAIPVLILATSTHPEWRLSRALDWSVIRWIGKISYSLYLWQQIFLIPRWEPHPFGFVQWLPISIVLPFLFATASYYWIERPAIRLGRKIAGRAVEGTRPAIAGTTAAMEAL